MSQPLWDHCQDHQNSQCHSHSVYHTLLSRHLPGQTPPQTDTPWDTPSSPLHAGIHTPFPIAYWDTHPPASLHAGKHTPLPIACWDTPWTDRHLWKRYLSAITVASGNKVRYHINWYLFCVILPAKFVRQSQYLLGLWCFPAPTCIGKSTAPHPKWPSSINVIRKRCIKNVVK